MRPRSIPLVTTALVGACVRIGAYECVGDDACVARAGGRCEDTRHCSYPDEDCPSGARYSEHAGPFANACTEQLPGSSTTTSSSSTSTSSTSSSASSTDGTSTGDPQPDVLWVFEHDGGVGHDAFTSVAGLSDGSFIVGGYQAVAGQSHDVLLARYSGPDELDWLVTRDFAGGLDKIDDVVFSPGGSVFVTGEHEPEPDAHQSWTGCFRAEDGGTCWQPAEEPTIGYSGRGIVYTVDNLVFATGSNSPQAGGFVSVRQSWGELAWQYVFADGELLSALAIGSQKFVGGHANERLFLGIADELGISELVVVAGPAEGPDAIQQLASDGETILAVGYVATQTSRNGWIGRFDVDGSLLWESSDGPADLDEELESVTVADGIVYAVGFATNVDQRDTLVASWTIEGEPLSWRSDFELSSALDIARDVVVLDSGILVVGETTDTADPEQQFLDAYALLLARHSGR